MREVCSKINKPRSPPSSRPALLKVKHAAIYNSYGPAAKATTPARNLADPDLIRPPVDWAARSVFRPSTE